MSGFKRGKQPSSLFRVCIHSCSLNESYQRMIQVKAKPQIYDLQEQRLNPVIHAKPHLCNFCYKNEYFLKVGD